MTTPEGLQPSGQLNVHLADAPEAKIQLARVDLGGRVYADPDWIALAQEFSGSLYAAVDRGRRLEVPAEPEPAAQYHLIIATAAIAAAEFETVAALSSLGLHLPAKVHARTIGTLARNAVVFKENAPLAKECYDSLDISRKELSALAQEIVANPELDLVMEQRYAEAAGVSMRKLELRQSELFKRDEHFMMSVYEQNEWSKWAHGDIIGLFIAGEGVRSAGTDLRTAIATSEPEALGLLFRTGLFGIVLLAVLADSGCFPGANVRALVEKHKALQARLAVFREERERSFRNLGLEPER